MRTVIFVYQTTPINISTCESNLQLCAMDAQPVSLSEGANALTISPGIYKIVSSQDVLVTGDTSAFDISVTTFSKTNDPVPPLRATETFASLDATALQAFLTVPEAKDVMNP
jgi:hypothetical protein